MIVSFGEWAPDLEEISIKGLAVAKNVVPGPDGYDSLNSLNSVTNALSGACVGAAWFSDKSGNVNCFAGDATKLYVLTGATWADKSIVSGYTGATNWEFAQFGQRIIATHIGNVVQYWDMGASTLFANLPGTPPQAARIAVVGDFVVLGDLYEGSTNKPNWVRWSGFNASELWTASSATQSDSQELFGRGGRVQKIIGGTTGIIFQEHAIRVMTFVGPPLIFRFDVAEVDSGTPAPNSVVAAGAKIFYYSHDGFYVFSLGSGSQCISDNRVTRWFQSECVDVTSLRGVVDREAQRVMWAFNAGGATNDRVIIYDWSINKWSYGAVDTEILWEFATAGYTLEEMDSLISDVDAGTGSVDDRIYQGGAISVAAFDSSHKTATFTGSPLDATLETGELIADRRLFINKMRPLVSGYSTMTAQVASRSTLQTPSSFGGSSALNASGEFTTRANARYHKFRLNLSGGFSRAVGLDVNAVPEGNR